MEKTNKKLVERPELLLKTPGLAAKNLASFIKLDIDKIVADCEDKIEKQTDLIPLEYGEDEIKDSP